MYMFISLTLHVAYVHLHIIIVSQIINSQLKNFIIHPYFYKFIIHLPKNGGQIYRFTIGKLCASSTILSSFAFCLRKNLSIYNWKTLSFIHIFKNIIVFHPHLYNFIFLLLEIKCINLRWKTLSYIHTFKSNIII